MQKEEKRVGSAHPNATHDGYRAETAIAETSRNCCNRKRFRAFLGMASMLHPDTPAKCCSYCGGRDHDFEECPKRRADAEREQETAREDLNAVDERLPSIECAAVATYS